MSDKPENPPAFPLQYDDGCFDTGMSLRDYFAAKVAAVQAEKQPPCARPDECEFIAKQAYYVADAMLKVRQS